MQETFGIARIAGQTALFSEILRLLVNKGIIRKDELHELASELILKARTSGAEAGFESASMHLLRIISSWDTKN